MTEGTSVRTVLDDHARLRAIWPGGYLDRELDLAKLWRNVKTLQYTSPFQVLTQQPKFTIFLICFGLFQATSVIRLIRMIQSQSVKRFNDIRVGSSSSITANYVLSFAKDGCETGKLFGALNSTQILNSSIPSPFEFDGFSAFIHIRNFSKRSNEAISITLDGTNDNWKTSKLCGSLNVRWTGSGIRFLPSPVPIRREYLISFYPPRSWYLGVLLPRALAAFGCLGCVCIVTLSSPIVAKAFCSIVFAALCTTSAVNSAAPSTAAATVSAIAAAVLAASLPTLMAAHAGAFSVDVLALLSALWFATAVIETCSTAGPEGCLAALFADPPEIQATAACLLLHLLTDRVRFHAQALRMAAESAAAACRIWSQLLDAEPGPLRRLDTICHRAAARCPAPCYARQFGRLSPSDLSPATDSETRAASRSSAAAVATACLKLVPRNLRSRGSASTGNRAGGAKEMNPGLPVASLDRLYSQALVLSPLLLARCSQWTALFRGTLHDRVEAAGAGPGSDVMPETSLAVPGTREWWAGRAGVKLPTRAAEKAAVCYGGDASRLLDVCRARIAFGKIADLIACLEAIVGIAEGPNSVEFGPRHAAELSDLGQPRDIIVVRIRNGFKPAYSSRGTAGYRAVILNLCIDTMETRRLGIEQHVCELQLTTAPFAAFAQDPNVHAQYVIFRATREFSRWPISLWNKCSNSLGLGVSSIKEWLMICGFECCECGDCSRERLIVSKSMDSSVFPVVDIGLQQNSRSDYSKVFCQPAAASKKDIGGEKDPWTPWERLPSGSFLFEDSEVALQVYLHCTLHDGCTLEQKATDICRAVQQSSTSGVPFTRPSFDSHDSESSPDIPRCSKPLAAMGSKLIFQSIWIIVAAYSACRFTKSLAAIRCSGRFPRGSTRLRVLELRSGAAIPSPAGPFFSAAGLLRDGCRLSEPERIPGLALDSDGILPLGNGEGYANGYYFITNGSDPQAHPIRWVVEVSCDNGTTWDQVGASIWRLTTTGSPLFFPALAYPMELSSQSEGIVEVSVDYRPPLSWMLTTVSEQLIYAIYYIVAAGAGLARRADLIARITVVALSVNSLFILAGISMAAPYMWREAVRLAFYAIGDMYLAVSAVREMNFIIAFTFGNVFIMTSASIVEVLLYSRELSRVLLQQMVSLASFAGLFSVVAFSFRHSTLAHAHRLVLPDRQRYNMLWTKALSVSKELDAMKAVSKQVNTVLQSNKSWTIPRHRCPAAFRMCSALQSGAVSRLEYFSCPWRLGDCHVTSLDQLFVQAWCLNPLLLHKVQNWALKSYGRFPCIQEDGQGTQFVLYEDALKWPGLQIKWAGVKSVHRAIEKLVRVYQQDVSRLVDLCRQSIVFDSLNDIALCLATMNADQDIQIVRVKNRLDPAYDAAESAGYRDVMVNLMLRGMKVEALGLDGHVCEVQLIYKPFANLKSDEGHQRYVAFRNLRGE